MALACIEDMGALWPGWCCVRLKCVSLDGRCSGALRYSQRPNRVQMPQSPCRCPRGPSVESHSSCTYLCNSKALPRLSMLCPVRRYVRAVLLSQTLAVSRSPWRPGAGRIGATLHSIRFRWRTARVPRDQPIDLSVQRSCTPNSLDVVFALTGAVLAARVTTELHAVAVHTDAGVVHAFLVGVTHTP